MAFTRVRVFFKAWYYLPMNQVRNCGTNVRRYSTYTSRKTNLWYLSTIGIGAGACAGAIYSYSKFKGAHLLRSPVFHEVNVLKDAPSTEVSRKVVYPSDSSGLHIQLYQYATCPFCCKVRAFFDYHGISYDIIEVNPVLRQQIKWSTYKKVPIVLVQIGDSYQQLNDSSMIISAVQSYLLDKTQNFQSIISYYPTLVHIENGKEKLEILNRNYVMYGENNLDENTKTRMKLEREWRDWVDNSFVHVLSPNVYRTHQESLETFDWFSEAGEWEKHFSVWERNIIIFVGATAMWIIAKQLKKRYNLKDDVRQSLYDECNVWLNAVRDQGTLFLGGDKPNLADLAVYGVLNSIEGSGAFKDIINHTKLGVWYWSVKSQVTKHTGSDISNQ